MDQAVKRPHDTTLGSNYVVIFDPSASIFVGRSDPDYLHRQMTAAFAEQPGIQSNLLVGPVVKGKKLSCVFGLTGLGHVALEQAINDDPENPDKKDFLARRLNNHFDSVRKRGQGYARWAGDACQVLETTAKLSEPRSFDALDPVSG